MALLILLGAGRGRGRAEVIAPEPAPPPVERLRGDLFPARLPFDPGAAPAGVYGASAQVCAACHPRVAEEWAGSAHARSPSADLLEAAVGMPACLGCHLPLTSQSDQLFASDGGRVDLPVATDNPGFQATLAVEGVTCAACHVRDGRVVAGSEAAAARPSPHPTSFAPALGSADGCAACHQLSWPGADAPLYDTYGEWKRAGFADIGLDCTGCHLRGAADGGPLRHDVAIDPARALTVELALPRIRLQRGAPAVPAALVLTNTGAGHAFPTGSPFRGVELTVTLAPTGALAPPAPLLTAALARSLDPIPPFALRSDTRLQVGESHRYELPVAVPPDAPPGGWVLRVVLRRTVRGRALGEPILDRRWSVVVE